MRIFLSREATSAQVSRVLKSARDLAGDPSLVTVLPDDGALVVDVAPCGHALDPGLFRSMPGVEAVEGEDLYRLASDAQGGQTRTVETGYGGVVFGADRFVVMAGPCAVENEADLLEIAIQVKRAGATVLRGGAFKPRTSPYCFQGLGEEGLRMLARVREKAGIAVVTEAMDPALVPMVSDVADIVQIGSRNMQNFPLLKAAGRQPKPVLLKRGMSATLEEWLAAAEYVMAEGNPNVILCERGIRTFSRHSRHTLDIGVIPALRERTSLPVVVDPSHATGVRTRVAPMAKAAIAAGAHGLLIEVHIDVARAASDGFQTITVEEFGRLMDDLRALGSVLGVSI